ncbi:hypothetical protein JKF63_05963 [Porcisia hertigi]|uniref:non-specific serine/threonine protein kinase n=1 Tax=Porcisia hertigi TaxID=2761500 RepID=A0A836IKF4_9TRYP|nr:hypothetical protein JKF63_05963 [Porcisia hertigi]
MRHKLNAALNTLLIDWPTIDQEMELVTDQLVAILLTCRLRSQNSGRVPAMALSCPRACEDSVEEPVGAEEILVDYEEAAAGAEELYVSAALRLAALRLDRRGLHRIVLALAYLANGGETQEERRSRHTGVTNSCGTSNTIHQRSAGSIGSAAPATAMAVGCPTFTAIPGTSTGLANTLHAHRNSFNMLAGRKFSTLTQAQQLLAPRGSFSTPMLSELGAPVHGGFSASASLDQVAQPMPMGRSTGGHQHSDAPKHPVSCSCDDAILASERRAIAAPLAQRMRCNCTPLGCEASDALLRLRLEADKSSSGAYSYGNQSYNNGLLRSMKARSTMASVLQGGIHQAPPVSSSSNPTGMSISTATGFLASVRTPYEDHLSGQCSGNSSYTTSRFPIMAPLHTTTQGIALQAPSTGINAVAGCASPSAAAASSLSSSIAHSETADPRRRADAYLRCSNSALYHHVVGGKVFNAGGRIHHSEVPNEDLVTTTSGVSRHLPLKPERGAWDSSALRLPSSGAPCQDTLLQRLPPEAVLAALCSTFAHLHLSPDDVTNLITLLIVSALQVQIEVQLRRLAAAPGKGSNNAGAMLHATNLSTPSSVAQIRSAVADCLRVRFYPLYDRTCTMLSAAAGVVANNLSNAASSPTNSDSAAKPHLLPRQTPAADTEQDITRPLSRPITAAFPSSSSELRCPTRPPASFPPLPRLPPASPIAMGTALHEPPGEAEDPCSGSTKHNNVASPSLQTQAIHDFFAENVPVECTPPSRGAVSKSIAAAQHHSIARMQPPQPPQPPQQQQQQSTLTAESPRAYSTSSDSAVGSTMLGPLWRSTAPNTATATTNTHVATRTLDTSWPTRSNTSPTHLDTNRETPMTVARPSQTDVRFANNFLMELETAFVLHYAEAIPCGYNGETGDSSTVGAGATAATTSTTTHMCRCRCDADPDVLVQFSSDATVWPLRTRLLVLRHDYVYVYGAVASTMALLRQDNLYTQETALDGSRPEMQEQPHLPHPHTPVALIDLSRAAGQKGRHTVQVLSGPGDVESMSLMPSRLNRAPVRGQQCRCMPAFTPLEGERRSSTPGSSHALRTDALPRNSDGARDPLGASASDILGACWATAGNDNVEVYRMKGSTGAMYLLSFPAGEEPLSSTSETPPSPDTLRSQTAMSSMTGGTAASVADALPRAPMMEGSGTTESSIVHRFERNCLVRRALLPCPASTTVSTSAAEATGGTVESQHQRKAETGSAETAAAVATSASPSIQCGSDDGTGEVLRLKLGNEPTCIAAYPLRLIYRGVLHHFFFANPSTRDKWNQKLVQLSGMMQSPAYMHKVASAPHDVERYLRNRFSFPAGPGAFECLDVLGVGTFGRVLLVQHKLSKRLFAMKVIRKSGFHGVRNIVEARREKRILDMLDCPYIMKIYSSFQTDSRVYMLFDYLPGAELLLHTRSAHRHHFDETTSRFYIAEIAVAVEYLRVRGIVHRDIKGDNIVLDSEGHVVLTDFGFAKRILGEPVHPNTPPRVIRQHTSCGTLAYIAPEVLNSARRRSGYGLEVDWWSLGVVLFTFLTGYFPFSKQTGQETSHAILHSALRFPPRPTLSEEARSLLNQLLQKDPDTRISSLAQLRQHPFFNGFDWAACCERRLTPPVVLHKDSYRSPSSMADARKLLHDRVRRSLAWSAGTSSSPYEPPSHSCRSVSDNLSIKFQALLEEEKEVLHLVAQAHGAQNMPKPLLESNDVFGPLFELQEHCGSHRDESDIEDLYREAYFEGIAQFGMEQMKQLKDSGAMREPHSPLSSLSLNSGHQEHPCNAGTLMDEDAHQQQRGTSAAVLLSMTAPFDVPLLADFTEELYADVVLAKYASGCGGGGGGEVDTSAGEVLDAAHRDNV